MKAFSCETQDACANKTLSDWNSSTKKVFMHTFDGAVTVGTP